MDSAWGMVRQTHLQIIGALGALLLSACAHRGAVPTRDIAVFSHQLDGLGVAIVDADSGTPWRPEGGERLFDGHARVASVDALLQGESRFSVEAGDLLSLAQGTRKGVVGAQTSLVRQRLTQTLNSSIPLPATAPVGLAYSQTHQTQWQLDAASGNAVREEARLSWAPAPLALDLSWTRQQGAAHPLLDCSVQGSVRFATFVEGPQLQLRGRSCAVFTPRMPAIQNARSWSAALMWPGAAEHTTLRLMSLEAQAAQPAQAERLDVEPAYEFGLTHAQRLGRWQATGRFAMRRRSVAPSYVADDEWLADASLRRRVRAVDLTASYRTGSGDDWFLPVEVDRVDRMALGLDLTHWFDLQLPAADVGFALSYEWQHRQPVEGQAVAASAVHGRLSWSW